MVTVSLYDTNSQVEEITCKYTRLKDGYLTLAWTDDNILKERILSSHAFSYAVIKSETHTQFQKEFNTEVVILNSFGLRHSEECDFAKIKEGFLVVTTRRQEDGKTYSIQAITPAREIYQVSITHKKVEEEDERNT